MPLISLLLGLPAYALTPDELEAKLAEVEVHREARLGTPPAIPAAEKRKAADGQVVTGSTSDGAVYGVGVVNAPISKLWAALNDETRAAQYTSVDHSEILSGKKCEEGRKIFQFVDIPVFMVSDRWWIGLPKANTRLMRDSGGAVRELTFSSSVDPALVTSPSAQALRDAAAPIGFAKGAWLLVALDARTTWVEYHTWNDPGAGVPAAFARAAASKGVRDNFAAYTKFANEGNPSCPIL